MVVPYQILNIIILKFSFLPFQIVILFSNVKHMKIIGILIGILANMKYLYHNRRESNEI